MTETNRLPESHSSTGHQGFQTKSAHERKSTKLLSPFELYEDLAVAPVAFALGRAEIEAHELVSMVVETALEEIVQTELRARMPANVSRALTTYLAVGLEMHFKAFDRDSEAAIKSITDPDDEPTPIPMDSWGRSNLPVARKPSAQLVDNQSYNSAKLVDFRENARKLVRTAKDQAHRYLTDFDESKMPKPIPLNEKVEEVGPEEIEVRNKKERQIQDQKELEKKKQEEERKKKDQEKLLQQAEKINAGDNQSIVTYAYDGNIIISNKKTATDKLKSVVLPTKVVIKNTEVEKSNLELQKQKAQQKTENSVLPKLAKVSRQTLEDMIAKSSLTSPNLNEMLSLTSGVTLIQNGRTKSNTNRMELRFNQTGTIRLNKEDFKKLQEEKRKQREKKLGDLKGRGKKKDGMARMMDDETSKKPEFTEQIDEDLPFATQTMKVNSMKQFRALRELAAPDMTMTTFNNTAISDFRRIQKEAESKRRMKETFMQSHTDTFNMEIMRGTVEQGARSKISGTTQAGSIVPHQSRLQAKKLTEDKLQPLPRNRSQKVVRQHHNVKDLMTPPGLGGAAGHELFTSKTTHHFFRG